MKTEKIEDLSREIRVPAGTIGVVSEVGGAGMIVMNVNIIVLPNLPLFGADQYPDPLIVISRVLTILDDGESLTVRDGGMLTSSKRIITNEKGRAKIERGGFLRFILGPGTKYKVR